MVSGFVCTPRAHRRRPDTKWEQTTTDPGVGLTSCGTSYTAQDMIVALVCVSNLEKKKKRLQFALNTSSHSLIEPRRLRQLCQSKR